MRPGQISTATLSYRLCYLRHVAQRQKRSISLPPDLADAIDQAAQDDDTTFGAWLAEVARDRLRLLAGRKAIAEWEAEHGALTEAELAEGLLRAQALLGLDTVEQRQAS
jgi:hypothetical protein